MIKWGNSKTGKNYNLRFSSQIVKNKLRSHVINFRNRKTVTNLKTRFSRVSDWVSVPSSYFFVHRLFDEV